MVRSARVVGVIGLGLLGACTNDPLAVYSIYGGLSPNPTYDGELPEVLWSAADTPANQGLLYTAMAESEVASQYAGRALARRDDPSQVRSAIGDVLYAIDPEQAPPWEAKSAGFVAGWAGLGYGVKRAVGGMAEQLHDQSSASSASPALAEYGPQAARCADNTLGRADQVAALGRQALEGAPGPSWSRCWSSSRAWRTSSIGGPDPPTSRSAAWSRPSATSTTWDPARSRAERGAPPARRHQGPAT